MEFIYLHGWASSPKSQKAQFFKRQFAQLGIPLYIPDLNETDFYHLTLTRQIAHIEALLTEQPVTLIGSSLGGLTALWLAERNTQIQQLITMAPALGFLEHCRDIVGEAAYTAWQNAGELSVFHYAWQTHTKISYAFIEDMAHYSDANLQRQLPTLILHGVQDAVISIQSSRDFSAQRSWVTLQEFESDHQLTDVQDQLWEATQRFLKL